LQTSTSHCDTGKFLHGKVRLKLTTTQVSFAQHKNEINAVKTFVFTEVGYFRNNREVSQSNVALSCGRQPQLNVFRKKQRNEKEIKEKSKVTKVAMQRSQTIVFTQTAWKAFSN
jgi:hypothetical protein